MHQPRAGIDGTECRTVAGRRFGDAFFNNLFLLGRSDIEMSAAATAQIQIQRIRFKRFGLRRFRRRGGHLDDRLHRGGS